MEDISQLNIRKEIGRRFSLASKSYRDWAIPQSEAVNFLFENFIRKHINPSDSVLDAGGGVGLLTEKILKLTGKVFVCDLSMDSLKINPAPYKVLCNLEKIPFKEESFDYVVSNFVIHWCNYRVCLDNFEIISKKGIFISVPVEGSLEGLGFPFPKKEEILEILNPQEWFVKELEIPFRGREFLMFFKKTGTGFNPNPKVGAFEILKNPKVVKNYSFKVLFAGKVK
jgi:malonyl-CoA O-methyltransferase